MSGVLDALAIASRDWIGDAPTGAMLSATRAFQTAALKDTAIVREAAASLGTQEPGSVAFIAVALGALVERGASAEVSGPDVFDQLRAWLPKLPVAGGAEEQAPVPTPEQAMLLARFQFLCQSVVTHLARLPAQRAAMGNDVSLLDRLDELAGYSPGAWWVHEALTKTSGTVILLHPPSGSGLRLAYANVSNGFHLFSLLQTAVGTGIPGGRVPNDNAASGNDEAWWHYGHPSSKTADLKLSVWGEGLVRELPRVDGEQVILLWPPILKSRGWNAGFFGPHLEAMPADASVERMLTADEVRAWLAKLGIARPKKWWWPF